MLGAQCFLSIPGLNDLKSFSIPSETILRNGLKQIGEQCQPIIKLKLGPGIILNPVSMKTFEVTVHFTRIEGRMSGIKTKWRVIN